MTSPPEPEATAPFQERERFRRGRTGSQISIILFILLFISYPAAFAGSNSFLVGILTASLFILTIAMVLNRLRMVNIAGTMVVLSVIAGPTVNIVTTPGGVNTSALPIFSLLVLPLMCAVSFLPPVWVFVVAAGHCLFTLYVLSFVPSSGELHHVLKVALPGVVTPILLSQGIVSLVAFLWVRGASLALLRADRAEEIAALEEREIERQDQEIEEKRKLASGIEQILKALADFSNGNVNARAPLAQDNILWRIAAALNTLFARLSSLRRTEAELEQANYRVDVALQQRDAATKELEQTKTAARSLVESIPRGMLPAEKSGTVIDDILAAVRRTGDKSPQQDAHVHR